MDYRAEAVPQANETSQEFVLELDMQALASVAGGVGEIAVG